jgi:hypothetical protein
MTETAQEPGSTAQDGPNHPEADQPGTTVEVNRLVTGATLLVTAATWLETVTAAVDSQSSQVWSGSTTLVVLTGSTYLVVVTVDFRVMVVVGSTQSTQV